MSVLLSLLALGRAQAPSSKERIPLLRSPFSESYEGPKVLGNLLVGLQQDDPADRFDIESIWLGLPREPRDRTVCVAIRTQDGTYRALNPYKVKANGGADAALDANSKYWNQLKQYGGRQVAVLARLVETEDCSPAAYGKLVVARQHETPSGARTIVAQINAEPNHIKLRLLSGQREVAPVAVCSSDNTRNQIAFESVCTLTPTQPLQPGEYKLSLSVREQFGDHTDEFPVLIVGTR